MQYLPLAICLSCTIPAVMVCWFAELMMAKETQELNRLNGWED